MSKGPVVGFTADLVVGGRTFVATQGAWHAPNRWKAITEFDETAAGDSVPPGSDYTMDTRSIGGEVWMQMHGWPAPSSGCWLQMGKGQVPIGILAMRPGEPAYVSLLAALEPISPLVREDGEVIGSAGLNAVLNVLPGQMVQELTINEEQLRRGNVPVYIALGDDGWVREVEIVGGALTGAMKDVGVEMSSKAKLVLAGLSVKLTFAKAPAKGGVKAPAADLVMTAADADAGRGCR